MSGGLWSADPAQVHLWRLQEPAVQGSHLQALRALHSFGWTEDPSGRLPLPCKRSSF